MHILFDLISNSIGTFLFFNFEFWRGEHEAPDGRIRDIASIRFGMRIHPSVQGLMSANHHFVGFFFGVIFSLFHFLNLQEGKKIFVDFFCVCFVSFFLFVFFFFLFREQDVHWYEAKYFHQANLLRLSWSIDWGLIVSRWFRFHADATLFTIFGLARSATDWTATAATTTMATSRATNWRCTMHKCILSRRHSFINRIQALCFSKWGDFVIRRESLKCCISQSRETDKTEENKSVRI